MAIRNAAGFLGGGELDEGFWYSVKRRLLGPPMVKRLMDSPPGLRTGVFGARLVLYAAELVVSPIALAVALKPRAISSATIGA